jgi:hypothetical protein
MMIVGGYRIVTIKRQRIYLNHQVGTAPIRHPAPQLH